MLPFNSTPLVLAETGVPSFGEELFLPLGDTQEVAELATQLGAFWGDRTAPEQVKETSRSACYMSDHCQSLTTSLHLVLKTKHYEVSTTDRVSKKITPTVNIYTQKCQALCSGPNMHHLI